MQSDRPAQTFGNHVPARDRFNRDRFRALVHYVVWICEDPRSLGPHRLNRVLWYSDRNVYLESGRPITGATYIRQQGGPQARPLQPMLVELEKDGVIARRLADRSGEFDLLFAIRRPDLSHFKADEISVVEAVTRVVCLDSRGSIAHQAAHDRVWQAAQIGEVLPYFTVFAGRPGDILASDIDWGMRMLHPREGRTPAGTNEPPMMAGAGKLVDRHQEAVDAALWHLNRDPSIGISLPATRASWFIYKQAGLAHLAVPDVVVVYGFDVDEFMLETVRLGSADDDDECIPVGSTDDDIGAAG
jgi:hypothetical protein